MGGITEIATGAPGYSSVRPNTMAPLAQTLKLNGYSHRTVRQVPRSPGLADQPVGPFDAWPTGGGGFEYFYGFIGGEANQWYPALYEGTTPVENKKTPEEGYHFTGHDRQGHQVDRQQKALMPDKPFFIYFAPGATHAPHHVPKEWADKYKGKFDQGWDKLREEMLRPPEGARRHPAGLPTHGAPQGNSRLGRRCPKRSSRCWRRADGGVCRLPGVHRPSRRAAGRRAGEARHAGRYADLSTSSATTAPQPRARSTAPSTR
jgi:arylsulfatase A-like enzyme